MPCANGIVPDEIVTQLSFERSLPSHPRSQIAWGGCRGRLGGGVDRARGQSGDRTLPVAIGFPHLSGDGKARSALPCVGGCRCRRRGCWAGGPMHCRMASKSFLIRWLLIRGLRPDQMNTNPPHEPCRGSPITVSAAQRRLCPGARRPSMICRATAQPRKPHSAEDAAS